MADLHPSEIAFLKDLAQSKASWLSAAVRALNEPHNVVWSKHPEAWARLAVALRSADASDDFRLVVSELLHGIGHSFLVALDGGSALAETTLVSVTDNKGHNFKRFLHEFWPEFSDDRLV